jgi:hypothetical protein
MFELREVESAAVARIKSGYGIVRGKITRESSKASAPFFID